MADHCYVAPNQKTATTEELSEAASVWLAVFGMGCPNCANRVRNSLLALDGVLDVSVSHVAGMAEIFFKQDAVRVPDLIAAVAQAGKDGRHEYWAVALNEAAR